jgi:predicted metal-dependent enzyme (double-stranded beta helix superfamily)
MRVLSDFRDEIASVIPYGPACETAVRRARECTANALAHHDFILGCLDAALRGFEEEPLRLPPRPLFKSPRDNFAAHFVYWPPKYRNSPHMHSSWGVTAAFHNDVVIEVFDRKQNESDDATNPAVLESRMRIEASPGEVGYLMPSCIHRVGNESELPAATLHLFGWDGPEQSEQNTTVWFGKAREEGMASGILPRAMEIFSEILLESREPLASRLMARVFALAPLPLKLSIVQRLATIDLAASFSLSTKLAAELEGSARDRVIAVNRKMAMELARC